MNPRARRRLWALPAAAAVALASTAGLSTPLHAAEPSKPAVNAAVQVTSDPIPVRNHATPQIARNPKTGDLVVVESDPTSQTRTCNVKVSADGGRSWFAGGDPMVKPNTDCSIYAEYGPYATAAFGKDGTLYVAFVASEILNRSRNDTPRSVFLARSTDSGRSFEGTTTVFKAPDGNKDRGLNKGPMLAVDPTDPNRVYVGWRQGIFASDAKEKLKSNIASSVDGGRHFSDPVDITDERGGDFPGIAVSGDGVVHAVYWTRTGIASAPPPPTPPVRPIQYVSSSDHGKTFSTPRAIDPGNQRAERPPLLVADPRTRDLYMAWYANADMNNSATGFKGDIDIFFRASHDAGATWTDRKTVNDDPAGKAHQFDVGIALAPNGRVDLAWYDGRLSPTAFDPAVQTTAGFQDVYYSSSSDRGATFTPNLRITDRSIDRSIGTYSNNISSHHNLGITSTDAEVWFAWQDSRNGNTLTGSEDVYATSLRINGSAPLSSPSRRSTSGASAGAVAASVLLGMGLAMAAVWAVNRRNTQPTPERAV